ncbi:MAG: sel1 repeat family protein [Cyanobacteria bacterium SZAS LIN-3]|nr:sel1 repeat family protein [Cyanobacteria bacterium SZAS LIN-3]MBS2005733.1 sel1 repeat family protein [Cyanobacteria bacterium SZAS TMP-1]
MQIRNMLVALCLLSLSLNHSALGADDEAAVLEQARVAMMSGDLTKSRQLLLPYVGEGKAAAQNLFGDLCALSGDATEAASWYRKAAEQGNAKAQNNLGMAYVKGEGVTQSETEAVTWLSKAAEQGHMKAQNNLSVMYSAGRGVKKDDAESAKWCRKAAEQGDPAAQINLGLKYRDGRGVEKNDKEALKWFLASAQQGSVAAQYQVGEMYEGDDMAEALTWYQRAAAHGYHPAQDKLVSLLPTDKQIEQGVLVLSPGQTASFEFDVVEGRIEHLRRMTQPVTPNSSAEKSVQSIDISMELDGQRKMTLLKIKNNYKNDLSYICSMNVHGKKDYQSTNVIPIRAGIWALESWPYEIDHLMIRNLHIDRTP